MGIVDSYAIIIYIVMFFTELKAVPCHKYGVCGNDLLIWIYNPLNNTNIPYYFSNLNMVASGDNQFIAKVLMGTNKETSP